MSLIKLLIYLLSFSFSFQIFCVNQTHFLHLPIPKNDEDKLKILMSIHEKIPELFSDAARFKVDLFHLLDDQVKLHQFLISNPEYVKKWNQRNFMEIEFQINSANTHSFQSKSIRADAVANWKNKLKSLLIEDNSRKINEEITFLISTISKFSSDGLINGLILNLPKNLQTKARELQKLQDKKSLLVYLDSHLEENLPNLKLNIAIEDKNKTFIFAKINEISEAEIELCPLLDLLFIKAQRAMTNKQLLEEIDQLDQQDLLNLSDIEYRKKGLEILFQNEDIKIPKFYDRYLSNYTSQVELTDSKIQSGYKLMLREQGPHLAIFRGCTGGDCSTQFSFPYPNDPNEKVFFIYDEKNSLKGYVSSTLVLDKLGNKNLYIITIAGSRINALDTEMILQGLFKLREKLGVQQIILPIDSNIKSLINFIPIQDIYKKSVAGAKNIKIFYQDITIREFIEKFPSLFNGGKFDTVTFNSLGSLYEIKDDSKLELLIRATPLDTHDIRLPSMEHIDPTALFEFCLALKNAGFSEVVSKAIDSLNESAADFNELFLLTDFQHTKNLMTRELDEKINHLLVKNKINLTRFKSKKYQWFLNSYLSTKDAIDSEFYNSNIKIILNDLKNNNPPLINIENLKRFEGFFKKNNTFNDDILAIINKLKSHPNFPQNISSGDVRVYFIIQEMINHVPFSIVEVIKLLDKSNVVIPIDQLVFYQSYLYLIGSPQGSNAFFQPTVSKISTSSREVHQFLIKSISGNSEMTNSAIINLLIQFKINDRDLINQMIQLLDSPHSSIRRHVGRYFSLLKEFDDQTFHAILELIKRQSLNLNYDALAILKDKSIDDNDQIIKLTRTFYELLERKNINQFKIKEILNSIKLKDNQSLSKLVESLAAKRSDCHTLIHNFIVIDPH